MDFFAAQDRSRRTTRFLLLFFLLAFLTVALATALVTGFALGWYGDQVSTSFLGEADASFLRIHARTITTMSLLILALMIIASLFRAATLARGGGQVARMLGATEISPDDADPQHRRLVNVVEEMAIASGLPVPEIYVLEQESGINAFAAGLTQSDAAIAVTRGALERLERAELQGVIAHEFSHVLNGDMRLNQKLIGFSYGILVLSLVGRWLLRVARYGRHGRNSGAVAAALGLGAALTVIGAIGVLFSRLIKAAVSRQREALADASAVQFTREPSALAGALKKIGGYTAKLTSVDDEEVAHMLFEGRARALARLFATHPPLVERIRALEPSFEPGDYIVSSTAMPEPPAREVPVASAFTGSTDTLDAVFEQTGQIESADVGQAIRAALPSELHHAAHHRESSLLLVLALALSPEAELGARQRQLIEQQLGVERATLCARLRSDLDELDRRLWLPLLELAMPAIKQRPAEQLRYLFDLVTRLTRMADGPRLFDYVLLRLLAAYLQGLPEPPLQLGDSSERLSAAQALLSLLSVVAASGHEDSAAARAAFRAGVATFGKPPRQEPSFEPLSKARDLAALDASLLRLGRLPPRAKRKVLKSVMASIRHDRKIETAEIELFRAIAATLGCPSPPALVPVAARRQIDTNDRVADIR